jgi:arginyl-tRNA synthetase
VIEVVPLAAQIESRLRTAMAEALPAGHAGAEPRLRRSDRADFQVDGLPALAKRVGGDPRELAGRVAAGFGGAHTAEVSGAGFVNITVSDQVLMEHVAARCADPRLGVPAADRVTTVVDYSQPNIAKEMHVGHLRSTIIGDALVRILELLGDRVIRQNHLGDWGTQFGMLIEHLAEGPVESDLTRLYQEARERFDRDPDFAARARRRVVALQSGDAATVERWRRIVAESKRHFDVVYSRLGVLLTDEDAVGESFYNDRLGDVADELEAKGVAESSDGALCVFPDRDGPPLIVRKSDGGYGYAATDLAALRHRVGLLAADRVLYVVDARQALHFRMVFETARRAGWLPDEVEAVHVRFGTVLGPDGTPFKTRAGDTPRLIELLDEAVARARTVVADKSPHLSDDARNAMAETLGVGAVKYADLATGRAKDYVFDVDRMVSLTGNTGVYLQYAHARTRSILRKLPLRAVREARAHPGQVLEPAERRLALELDGFGAVLHEVAKTYEPHRLCGYLFDLARAYNDFFEKCHVVRAPSGAVRDHRVLLVRLTGDTVRTGLRLLGLAAPDRL